MDERRPLVQLSLAALCPMEARIIRGGEPLSDHTEVLAMWAAAGGISPGYVYGEHLYMAEAQVLLIQDEIGIAVIPLDPQ